MFLPRLSDLFSNKFQGKLISIFFRVQVDIINIGIAPATRHIFSTKFCAV